MFQIPSLDALVEELSKLPSIGRKSAMRMAYNLVRGSEDRLLALEGALRGVRERLRTCETCFGLAETSPCPICADPRRDRSVLCIVEEPMDLFSFEQSATFRGDYHVLGGTLNPMRGVHPDDLHIDALMARLTRSRKGEEQEAIREVILATNPDVDGEATAHYLADEISALGSDIRITRLGLGLPMGGDLEYADQMTISKALEGRRPL